MSCTSLMAMSLGYLLPLWISMMVRRTHSTCSKPSRSKRSQSLSGREVSFQWGRLGSSKVMGSEKLSEPSWRKETARVLTRLLRTYWL